MSEAVWEIYIKNMEWRASIGQFYLCLRHEWANNHYLFSFSFTNNGVVIWALPQTTIHASSDEEAKGQAVSEFTAWVENATDYKGGTRGLLKENANLRRLNKQLKARVTILEAVLRETA
jgi:hypothetical protein